MLSAKHDVKRGDLCSTCVNTFDALIYFVIQGIMDLGIITTCDDLCSYVTKKSESPYLEAICSIACDVVGINEFIRIATKVDLDPIYFCELLTLCPVNDHGDAKIQAFVISPPHATASTKFVFDLTFQSMNGTGTGQLLYTIHPVDDLRISSFLLIEEKKPGLYAERFTVDTTPDPDCVSDITPCELWMPGVYNITVMICNGECNSHHPHSQTYDTVKSSFQID
ncbi:unnamed protein product [Adineta ricciae]|uniref:Saposin B-type domain-containing protein n=1 Tax=Adineta ricciae TaxID=249248 RepID=A0A815BWP1_ADIRI|nr:unnamed protein product [Adineta ricciae]CAF1278711.1 unnamed protein product [Adineta ricciae]